jgi:hypothetical protein
MRRILPVVSVLWFLSAFALSAVVVVADDAAPAADAQAAKVKGLIDRLGAEDFREREQASRDLEAMGDAARPALEEAMKASASLEVRWRAEQILRRLDRRGARPIEEQPAERGAGRGAEGEKAREPSAPATGETELDRFLRWLEENEQLGRGLGGDLGRSLGEEFRRQLEEGFGGFGRSRMPRFDLGSRHVEVPGMKLDIGFRGNVKLEVQKEDGTVEVHRARSLDDLVRRNPALADLPGWADLVKRAKDAARSQAGLGFGSLPSFGGPLGSMSKISISRGDGSSVELTQEPGKAVVKITKKDAAGAPTTKTFEGTDVEQLKRDHPEVAEALEGLDVHLGATTFRLPPPQVFFGDRGQIERDDDDGEADEPFVPDPRPLPPSDPRPDVPFGVTLARLEPTLAFHLGIPEDGGLLVAEVHEGTQAKALGLQRHDVIVSVDGAPVGDMDHARTTLRAAAKAKAPLTLEVIRAGKRTTLKR